MIMLQILVPCNLRRQKFVLVNLQSSSNFHLTTKKMWGLIIANMLFSAATLALNVGNVISRPVPSFQVFCLFLDCLVFLLIH